MVNFAAESHVDRSIHGAADFVLTNVLGAQQVFEAALRHEVGRVVHVSTDEVYGSIDEGSWTEDHILEPNSPYSAAKAGSDLIARAYAKTYGLNISITRCSNNYGPYHFPEKVIPLFVTNLLDGEKVPLYGEGANVRDWLHVDDHCRGIQLVRRARAARRVLQHRRRPRAVQQGAHREAARGDRPRLELRREHHRPARRRPRPALLGRLLEDRRARLRAADDLRGRPGHDGAVVPRQPRLVGAAQGRGGDRTRWWARRTPSERRRHIAWLVTGARGQLGTRPARGPRPRPGDDVTGLGRAELDLTDEAAVRAAVRDWLSGVRADRAVVLNAAAYTAVDAAETDEATADAGQRPGARAGSPRSWPAGARLVHVSTDYVFDGDGDRAVRRWTRRSRRASAYGRTKAAGERAVAAAGGDATVVRTAWVYGAPAATSCRRCSGSRAQHETLTVVDDQRGSPTWSADLAAGLVELARRDGAGAAGCCTARTPARSTWCGFARAVFEELGADPERVRPITTAEFPRPAPRPAYSVLDGGRGRRPGSRPSGRGARPSPRRWPAASAPDSSISAVSPAGRPHRGGVLPTEALAEHDETADDSVCSRDWPGTPRNYGALTAARAAWGGGEPPVTEA